MNRKELNDRHVEFCDSAKALMEKKNQDYASTEDAFGNLMLIENLTGGTITMEMGITIRLTDKIKRLATYEINGGFAVNDEGVRDTCLDIINYAVLLLAKHEERNANVLQD